MRKKETKLRSHCPINFALEAFGDKWALLIIRDIIFRGKRSYAEFLSSEESIATNILSVRLKKLLDDGLLRKDTDADDKRRDCYFLTEKGIDLVPIIFYMIVWSHKYDPVSEARKIKKLISRIALEHNTVVVEAQKRLKKGLPLFPDYLD